MSASTRSYARRPHTGTAAGRAKRRSRRRVVVAVEALLLAGFLAFVAVSFVAQRRPGGASDTYAYSVGSPGPGAAAPAMRLPSTSGDRFDLAALRGTTTLLFFQEGLMCQPCWDQLRGIEASWDRFAALGIDSIATITTDPADGLKRKVADERLTTPVLSDAGAAVSKAWGATGYGMHADQNYNGHSFILVRPDGTIGWRADYGGPPNYTMFVPLERLLSDMQKGMAGGR